MLACYDITTVDMDKPVKVEQYAGVLSTYDRSAHVFGAKMVRDGLPLVVSNVRVAAYFTNANGETHTCYGMCNSDKAMVNLTDMSAYLVPGRFKLVIKVENDNTIRTLRIIHGYVKEGADSDMIEDIDFTAVQTGDGEVTLTISPAVNVGTYEIGKGITNSDGSMNMVQIATINQLTYVYSGAAIGYHTFYVRPVINGEVVQMGYIFAAVNVT